MASYNVPHPEARGPKGEASKDTPQRCILHPSNAGTPATPDDNEGKWRCMPISLDETPVAGPQTMLECITHAVMILLLVTGLVWLATSRNTSPLG
ncbi:hypothetical protein [Rhizobium leguminosarum]|uniref:Uncharacterized protein n=1 Tax=Rhizobium leguminosarum TaxID=384 RepID=A0A1B1C8S7_RHILE|nr:hypothetical protein [Rhizobium leguminosarum]ANP86165.1 hypothetical protein BA011_10770 [Rhizobium leguminosarum]